MNNKRRNREAGWQIAETWMVEKDNSQCRTKRKNTNTEMDGGDSKAPQTIEQIDGTYWTGRKKREGGGEL